VIIHFIILKNIKKQLTFWKKVWCLMKRVTSIR